MEKSQSLKEHIFHVKVASVLMGFLYVFVSVSTFYATRLALPIVGNLGRGALSGIPVVLTLFMPLVIFYFLLLYLHSTSTIHKRQILLILGIILIIISLFNLIDLAFVIPLLFEGNMFVGVLSPLYPLDMLIYNILLFLLAITILIFHRIDTKDHIVTTTCETRIPPRKWVFVGFLLPIASYFFGEIMISIEFWFEPIIIESLPIKILTYVCFLIPTIGLLFYYISFHKGATTSIKKKLSFNLSMAIIPIILLIGFTVATVLHPTLIAEYLQYEFAFGIILKVPFGIYVATILPAVISFINVVRLMVKKEKKEVTNEQKQTTF